MFGFSATRSTVAGFGAMAGMAGVEHGVGEIRQGWEQPSGIVVESWPDVAAFEPLGGEPALTIIPNLLIGGLLAVVVAVALGAWTVLVDPRRRGGRGTLALSALLLLVGGGFGPPMVGIVIGVAGARARRDPPTEAGTVSTLRAWRMLLVIGIAAYLALFPGVVLAKAWFDAESDTLVGVLSLVAFAALIGAVATARAADRVGTEDGQPGATTSW